MSGAGPLLYCTVSDTIRPSSDREYGDCFCAQRFRARECKVGVKVGGAVTGTALVVAGHGNNKQNPRPQEIYYLMDNFSWTIQKIGLRGQELERYSDACLKTEGVTLVVTQRIQGGPGARSLGLSFEAAHLGIYMANHLGNMPPRQVNFPC